VMTIPYLRIDIDVGTCLERERAKRKFVKLIEKQFFFTF
jgi:hypothetical protein